MNYLEISTLFLFIIFLIIFYIINFINNEINNISKKEEFENHLTQEDVDRAKREMEETKRKLAEAQADFKKYKKEVDNEKKKVNNNIQSIEKWEKTRNSWFNELLAKINYLKEILREQRSHLNRITRLQRYYEGSKWHKENPDSNYNRMEELKGKFFQIQAFNDDRSKKINKLTNRINSVNEFLGDSELF